MDEDIDIDECIETIKNNTDEWDVGHAASEILGAIFEGECRHDALAEVLKRKDIVYHRYDCGNSFPNWVWDRWYNAYKNKVAATSVSQELADIMTEGFGGYSRDMSDFRRVFPDNASKMFNKVLLQNLPVDKDFIKAFADKITPENVEKINPKTLDGLLALIKTVSSESISSQWLTNVFVKAAGNGYPYGNEEATSSIMKALDGGLRDALVEVLQDNAKRVYVSKSFIAELFLETPGINGKILEDAIKYLAGLKNVYVVTIATPYHIPDTLTGKKLCKTLIYMDRGILNPKDMIKGLPSEEDFKIKAFDCLLSDKPLYDKAIDALRSLHVKVVMGKNYLGQLKTRLSSLPEIVEGDIEDKVFLRAKGKGCWDMFMDLIRCIIKNSDAYDYNLKGITHEKAKLMVEALDKLFTDVDWQNIKDTDEDEDGEKDEENEGLAETTA